MPGRNTGEHKQPQGRAPIDFSKIRDVASVTSTEARVSPTPVKRGRTREVPRDVIPVETLHLHLPRIFQPDADLSATSSAQSHDCSQTALIPDLRDKLRAGSHSPISLGHPSSPSVGKSQHVWRVRRNKETNRLEYSGENLPNIRALSPSLQSGATEDEVFINQVNMDTSTFTVSSFEATPPQRETSPKPKIPERPTESESKETKQYTGVIPKNRRRLEEEEATRREKERFVRQNRGKLFDERGARHHSTEKIPDKNRYEKRKESRETDRRCVSAKYEEERTGRYHSPENTADKKRRIKVKEDKEMEMRGAIDNYTEDRIGRHRSTDKIPDKNRSEKQKEPEVRDPNDRSPRRKIDFSKAHQGSASRLLESKPSGSKPGGAKPKREQKPDDLSKRTDPDQITVQQFDEAESTESKTTFDISKIEEDTNPTNVTGTSNRDDYKSDQSDDSQDDVNKCDSLEKATIRRHVDDKSDRETKYSQRIKIPPLEEICRPRPTSKPSDDSRENHHRDRTQEITTDRRIIGNQEDDSGRVRSPNKSPTCFRQIPKFDRRVLEQQGMDVKKFRSPDKSPISYRHKEEYDETKFSRRPTERLVDDFRKPLFDKKADNFQTVNTRLESDDSPGTKYFSEASEHYHSSDKSPRNHKDTTKVKREHEDFEPERRPVEQINSEQEKWRVHYEDMHRDAALERYHSPDRSPPKPRGNDISPKRNETENERRQEQKLDRFQEEIDKQRTETKSRNSRVPTREPTCELNNKKTTDVSVRHQTDKQKDDFEKHRNKDKTPTNTRESASPKRQPEESDRRHAHFEATLTVEDERQETSEKSPIVNQETENEQPSTSAQLDDDSDKSCTYCTTTGSDIQQEIDEFHKRCMEMQESERIRTRNKTVTIHFDTFERGGGVIFETKQHSGKHRKSFYADQEPECSGEKPPGTNNQYKLAESSAKSHRHEPRNRSPILSPKRKDKSPTASYQLLAEIPPYIDRERRENLASGSPTPERSLRDRERLRMTQREEQVEGRSSTKPRWNSEHVSKKIERHRPPSRDHGDLSPKAIAHTAQVNSERTSRETKEVDLQFFLAKSDETPEMVAYRELRQYAETVIKQTETFKSNNTSHEPKSRSSQEEFHDAEDTPELMLDGHDTGDRYLQPQPMTSTQAAVNECGEFRLTDHPRAGYTSDVMRKDDSKVRSRDRNRNLNTISSEVQPSTAEEPKRITYEQILESVFRDPVKHERITSLVFRETVQFDQNPVEINFHKKTETIASVSHPIPFPVFPSKTKTPTITFSPTRASENYTGMSQSLDWHSTMQQQTSDSIYDETDMGRRTPPIRVTDVSQYSMDANPSFLDKKQRPPEARTFKSTGHRGKSPELFRRETAVGARHRLQKQKLYEEKHRRPREVVGSIHSLYSGCAPTPEYLLEDWINEKKVTLSKKKLRTAQGTERQIRFSDEAAAGPSDREPVAGPSVPKPPSREPSPFSMDSTMRESYTKPAVTPDQHYVGKSVSQQRRLRVEEPSANSGDDREEYTHRNGDLFNSPGYRIDTDLSGSDLTDLHRGLRRHPPVGRDQANDRDLSADISERSPASRLNIAEIKRRGRMQRLRESSDDLLLFDPYDKSFRTRKELRRRTGLVYSWNAIFHKCEWDVNYPERPERYTVIMDRIKEYGLFNRCVILDPRKATTEEVTRVHDIDTVELLETACLACESLPDYERFASCYDAIFINPHTYDVALTAAGSCIELVDSIIKKKVQNGMAIVRPPGHHAMRSEFNGYCIFNNAAIAALHAIEKRGLTRIMIVDLDVHHGQGIQQQFFDSKKVLYFSIHRYEFGKFWPNLAISDYDYVGEGEGLGFNFNVPLNEVGMTDMDYFCIFDQLLMPVAHEFRPQLMILCAGYDALLGCPEYAPELVILSAGYDSLLGDDKGEMRVSPACYAHLTHMLSTFAKGRMAVFLEGGYNLVTLAEGAALTLRALLDDPVPALIPLHLPKESVLESITNCIAAHKKYWKCFNHCTFAEAPDALIQPAGSSDHVPNKFPTRNCYPTGPGYPDKLFLDLDIQEQINYTIGKLMKPYAHKVCIIFDERLLEHTNRTGSRPMECPDRLSESLDLLKRFGLLDRCMLEEGRKLMESTLTKVHTLQYLQELKTVIAEGDDDKYTSVFTNEKSFECALIAAGSSLYALDLVLAGTAQTVFALIRPPGHHAEPDKAMGFCLFNNVSLVAKYGLEKYNLQRILIVDFDVHHCNGTFKVFEKDDQVLVVSLHRHDRGKFFPGTGHYELIGDGPGVGYNINIPWNQNGIGNAEYLSAFNRIVMPISRKFNPDVVLISAGFDAAYGDPLGQCCLTPEMYGHMVHMLKGLAQGRVLMFLEGGYNITSLSHSVVMCVKALLGDPLVPLESVSSPSEGGIKSINDVISLHQAHWPFLQLPDFDLYKTETRAISCLSIYGDRLRFCPLPPRCECDHITAFLRPIPRSGINTEAPCRICRDHEDNYCCLTCYWIGCSPARKRHMQNHALAYQHPLVISQSDLSVWCYKCLSYVNSPELDTIRNIFHIDKFGETLSEH